MLRRSKGVNPTKTGTFEFYEDHVGWFIDLPTYTGPRGDLQMICGADHVLDELAQKKRGSEMRISVKVSSEPFDGANQLKLIGTCPKEEGGADYTCKIGKNKKTRSVWLCDVTLLVLGSFPETIYFSKI